MRLGKGGYYDPSDPVNAVFVAAYEEFWRSVQLILPEVFEDLYNRALPTYRVFRELLEDENISYEAEYKKYNQMLTDWAIRWNLQALPLLHSTITECVLLRWIGYPDTIGKFGSYQSVLPVFKCKILGSKLLDFILPSYEPTLDNEEDYRAYVTSLVDEHIKQRKIAVEEMGLDVNLLKRNRQHFDWLVLYAVKGLTCREIVDYLIKEKAHSKKDKVLSESAVYRAVAKTAELISLPLKKKRGRPSAKI